MEEEQKQEIIKQVESILNNCYEDTRYVLLLEAIQGGTLVA